METSAAALSALGLPNGVAGWAELSRLVGAALIGAGAACTMGCTVGQGLYAASTASAIELRQRVEASRQRSADDLRRTNEDNAQLRRSVLDLSNEIEQLRNEVATLRGQNETLRHDMETMQRSQGTAQGVDERLRMSEPAKVTVDGREFVAKAAEKQAFDAALAAFDKGNFAEAQIGFASFVRRYPQSGYKASALLGLGNSQYALHNYRDAEASFQALVTAEPSHPRAPEALLSMANCQLELKDVKSARKTFEDLVKAYPQSEAAYVAKERLARLR
jgi:tol-pal system protein YbgF